MRMCNFIFQMQTLSRWAHVYRRCPQCAAALKMRISKSGCECLPCNRVYYPTVNRSLFCINLPITPSDAPFDRFLCRPRVYSTIPSDLSPFQYSPVTICLVTDPTDEHCILVRHRGSAAGVFTCIAGFAMVGSLLFLAFLFNLPINNSLVNQSLVLMRLLSTDGE